MNYVSVRRVEECVVIIELTNCSNINKFKINKKTVRKINQILSFGNNLHILLKSNKLNSVY